MWPIGRIAERDGVTKQAISKQVKRLVGQHALVVERDRQGRIAAVNVAEYDHLRGRFGDPSKAQAPAPSPVAILAQADLPLAPAQSPASPESYDEALRQKTWIAAEKSRLELDELKGELLRAGAVDAAVLRCGEDIARIIDRLPNAADDLAVAVARDGVHGLRVTLKALARRMRTDVAAAMDTLAKAPTDASADEPETAAA